MPENYIFSAVSSFAEDRYNIEQLNEYLAHYTKSWQENNGSDKNVDWVQKLKSEDFVQYKDNWLCATGITCESWMPLFSEFVEQNKLLGDIPKLMARAYLGQVLNRGLLQRDNSNEGTTFSETG